MMFAKAIGERENKDDCLDLATVLLRTQSSTKNGGSLQVKPLGPNSFPEHVVFVSKNLVTEGNIPDNTKVQESN